MRRESSDARSLGFPGAHLWSISSGAELALGLRWETDDSYSGYGTLARVPLAGGAAREVLEDVTQADWSPDGRSLAVARLVKGEERLEFPIGTELFESPGAPYSSLRVSPRGDLVAFIQDLETVAVVDRAGKKKDLSTGWYPAQGLAWSPNGDEVWFTAAKGAGQARALWAVSLSGRQRLLSQVPGRLTLQDIARDGTVLLTHDNVRREMVVLPPAESRERDLTWLGYSWPTGLSRDGRTVFFGESVRKGPTHFICVGPTAPRRPESENLTAEVGLDGLQPHRALAGWPLGGCM